MPKKGKVLVVDDEPLVCEAIAMMLSFDGYEVVTAGDGKAAMALFEPGKFELVTTDYTMPGMNGLELALAIKAQASNQPVILITAHADMLKSSAVPLTGVDQMVGKPFQFAELRAAIQKVAAR